MGLWSGNRGQALQVGAILLFGIAILAASTYQAVGVPIENERVEFNHNQAVQQDMLELRGAVLGAGGDTTFRSVSVQLGTTYPPRVLLVNPPPASGSLRTAPPRNVSLGNVTATDNETDDFLNTTETDGPYNLSTRPISYQPGYNEYDSAPTTTVGAGVTVNENPRGDDTALTDQTVVDGNEITLVAVTGNLSAARSGGVAVDPKSLSVSTQATTVTNNSTTRNITITVPTTLSAERWRALLDGENRVNRVDAVPGRDAVEFELDGGVTYRLRTALVGVGSVGVPPGPAYITAVDGDDDVTIEVRDRYNNPVSNSRVDDTLFVNATENRLLLADPRVEVDEDGQAEFAFNSTATSNDAPATLNFTLENGSRARVVPDTPGDVTVVVEKSDLPAGGGEDDSPSIDEYEVTPIDGGDEIKAEATVSDQNDDLSEATFELFKNGKSKGDPESVTITGGSDKPEKQFDINGKPKNYEVKLTVTDENGNTASSTKSPS